jgi:hypothetical protein
MLCDKVEIGPSIIILDKEVTLSSLPGWVEGDMFKLIIGANGNVTFIKVTQPGGVM